jgi:sporulation-control protein spo0M
LAFPVGTTQKYHKTNQFKLTLPNNTPCYIGDQKVHKMIS